MIQSFVITILKSGQQAQGGQDLAKICSLLTTSYMPGKGLTQDKIKEVLEGMVHDNKTSFISNKYVLQ